MATYTIELRDSDGNDCTVYDVLVTAETPEKALDQVWDMIRKEWPKDEEDGGDGTYHPCDCVCDHRKRSVCDRCQDGWECSHGGLLVGTPEEGNQHAVYHSLIDLT